MAHRTPVRRVDLPANVVAIAIVVNDDPEFAVIVINDAVAPDGRVVALSDLVSRLTMSP